MSEWNAPSLPSSPHTVMPTLGEILNASHSDSTSRPFLTPACLYAAFLYLFGRIVDFHRYCTAGGWLHFAPPDGKPARRVRGMVEELEEELVVWKNMIGGLSDVDGECTDTIVVNLNLAYHALWTVLHGPSLSLIKFGYELLTPAEHRPPQAIHNQKAEDVVDAWSSSTSFVTAVSHAFEASNLLSVLPQNQSTSQGLPASVIVYYLGHIAVILLLPALRMQQAGMQVQDIRQRTHIIIAKMRLLESASGSSVLNLVISLVELLLQKLDGRMESFDSMAVRLFEPEQSDSVTDAIVGTEQIEAA
ncbi:hypothetical protein HDU93_006279 [Gonapodya sp. JEL0774]|nr:hypothetical protein HDU93_006279 [Gonapodya sp. JEL0774]